MRHERHGTYHYCTMCDYYTRKSTTLSMHFALKHNSNSPHRCKECPSRFQTKSQLNHHIMSRHTQSTISCIDPACSEKFKNKPNQMIHYLRKHMDLTDLMKYSFGEWKCLTCGKLNSKNTISYHVMTCSPLSPFTKLGGFIDEEAKLDDNHQFLDTICGVCTSEPTSLSDPPMCSALGSQLMTVDIEDLPLELIEDFDMDGMMF